MLYYNVQCYPVIRRIKLYLIVMVHLCIMFTFTLQTGTKCETKEPSCVNVFKTVHTKLVTHFSWLHSSKGHHRLPTSTVSLNKSSFTIRGESCSGRLFSQNGISMSLLLTPMEPAKVK